MERRRTSPWQTIAADPYRKLAAVALAIGLWYFLDTQVTKEYTVTAELLSRSARDPDSGSHVLVNLPSSISVRGFVDVATGRPLSHVNVTFRSLKYVIDNLQGSGALELRVGPFPERRWDEAEGLEFTAGDIRLRADRLQQNVEIEMDPPRVRVNLERKDYITFSLTPDLATLQLDVQFRSPRDEERLRPRLLLDRTTFSKEVIKVLGPQSHLQALRDGRRKPFSTMVDVSSDGSKVTGNLTLENPEELDLELETDATVTIELSPDLKPFSFALPLRLDDRSLPAELRGKYRLPPEIKPDDPTLAVEIRVGGQLQSWLDAFGTPEEQAQWARQYLRLDYWIPPRESYPADLTLEPTLVLLGPLATSVNPVNYVLGSGVPLKVSKQQ